MNKDEKILEILNSKPTLKIGLDDFYGRQAVLNMLKEAINYSQCCKSDSGLLPKHLSNEAYTMAKGTDHKTFTKWWDMQV